MAAPRRTGPGSRSDSPPSASAGSFLGSPRPLARARRPFSLAATARSNHGSASAALANPGGPGEPSVVQSPHATTFRSMASNQWGAGRKGAVDDRSANTSGMRRREADRWGKPRNAARKRNGRLHRRPVPKFEIRPLILHRLEDFRFVKFTTCASDKSRPYAKE